MRRSQLCLWAAACASLLGAPALAQPEPAPEPVPRAAPKLVPPKLLSDPTVLYPDGARGDATVIVTLVVDASGAVTSAVADAPNEPFSSRAVERALGWRFEPATRDGQPVSARIRVEVVFREPEPEPEPEPAPAAGSSAPSCAGLCGSSDPAPGSEPKCYCDAQCAGYGDCCTDFGAQCGGSAPPPSAPASCQGHCGSSTAVPGSSPACYCDAMCVTYGDCCADAAAACGL